MKIGIEPERIAEKIYERSDFQDMKLLGLSLSTLERTKDGKVAWLYVTDNMLKKAGVDLSATERFVNFPRAIDGVKVALFFKQVPGSDKIKVSLRSKGKSDVNRIAKAFGGGGHRNASGCEVKAPLNKAIKAVLKEVKKEL